MAQEVEQAEHQWLMPAILATQEIRDQEDHPSKPGQANSSRDPSLKKPITK
jgi:hypothetical protein